jgi:DNA-binding GntR family transcriptional regulator
VDEHEALLAAVAAHDETRAVRLAARHRDMARRRVLRAMGGDDVDAGDEGNEWR